MAAVKALQQWCRLRCEGYRDVAVTNMTTSFRDGLAFCALIHRHRPELIDFDSLRKENVYDNNKLAFTVAEEQLGIPALLDAEDMVALKVPDRLSILTYVSQYYNYFHGRSPIGGMGGIKRPAEGATDEPSGKKNQPVVAKVFPSSKPARENSPPPSSRITRPPPSPKPSRNVTQEAPIDRSHRTGTLSNMCVSCNKHVHLVQRHLVDGKLYHRNCAKSLSSTNTLTPLRDLPTNTPVSKLTPVPDATKTSTATPPQPSSRLGPKWLIDKPSPPSTLSTTVSPSPPSRPRSGVSPAANVTPTAPVSKPAASQSPSESIFTTTTSIRPVPVPRTSATAAKTVQSKLKFFQSDSNAGSEEKKTPTITEEKKTTTINVEVNKPPIMKVKVQEAAAGQPVTVVLGSGGGAAKKGTTSDLDKGGDKAKAAGGGGKVTLKQEEGEINKTKAAAADFICKKLAEENNNNSSSSGGTSNKPTWMASAEKKPEKPARVETPKKETGGVRGRVKLRADPSLLADLTSVDTPAPAPTPTLAPTTATRSGLRARTPERGDPKPRSASPNPSASENESPADWRSRLKPVAKKPVPAAPPNGPATVSSQATSSTTCIPAAPPATVRPWANGAGKPQTSELSAGPPSHVSTPSVSVTPPPSKGFQNVPSEQTANGNKSESKTLKIRPDYIPKEDILRELQNIEDTLNDLEKRGVELEVKLRSSEEDGEDDSLMVEWFNLIRNKQVAMRRESELVYIGRTQDLEEQQPTVEQELRRLMEKPEHLKTPWDRKREQQLMDKLVEIVNDRNAIVDGLDEDRLREEEEDEELNKMMMNFNIKKDKSKKKSPVSRLFSWGNKKEG